MMRLSHITKSFDKQKILHDINLDIEDGVIMGLIGANGAGKSTLLRIIAGIYQSDLGSVYLDDVKVYDEPQCKKDILLIGDEPFHFFNSTLKEMKEFYKLWYPQFDELLYLTYIEQFRLDEHKAMGNFSKGMLRQAFLLIGLAIAPRYLLLDEAFDGLDPMMRSCFKRAIAERIEAKKMSVIISSHDLKEMQDLCDCFAMIDHGTLDTSGDMSGTLEQVHKFQMAFQEAVKPEVFAELGALHVEIESRVACVIVRGDQEKIEAYLRTLKPILLEVLPVSLEELFIHEVEQRGGLCL